MHNHPAFIIHSGLTHSSCEHVVDNPFLELLNVEHTVWREGYSEFEMAITPAVLNRQRVLQGGVISTLLDAACGYSGLYSPDAATPIHGFTLSLTMNFLDKGLGDRITAKGYLERKGKSVFFARGEAWVDSRILIATALGTFKYVRSR
ncbi:PaaI family thioesterase [Pigmentiphaga litoralis]|uniref:PaaI family thioesterase n=1 Tax=Pigmentiphaga litoralis TaxID=516702 RepID=UPI003B434EA9